MHSTPTLAILLLATTVSASALAASPSSPACPPSFQKTDGEGGTTATATGGIQKTEGEGGTVATANGLQKTEGEGGTTATATTGIRKTESGVGSSGLATQAMAAPCP